MLESAISWSEKGPSMFSIIKPQKKALIRLL